MILAYVDPGMGQLIWLSIVSACTGVIFYLKKTRAWIVNFFLKIFARGQKSPSSSIVVEKNTVVEKVEVKIDEQ